MTNNKIRKLLAIVACVLALVLFAVGLINLPKRGSESGLKVLENYRIQAILKHAADAAGETPAAYAEKDTPALRTVTASYMDALSEFERLDNEARERYREEHYAEAEAALEEKHRKMSEAGQDIPDNYTVEVDMSGYEAPAEAKAAEVKEGEAYDVLRNALAAIYPSLDAEKGEAMRDGFRKMLYQPDDGFAEQYDRYREVSGAKGTFSAFLIRHADDIVFAGVALLVVAAMLLYSEWLVKKLGIPRVIIGLFFILLCFMTLWCDLSLPTLLSNTVVRMGMNAVMVLAMVPGIQCGISLNLGLPIGLVAGLIGGLLTIEFGIPGWGGFLFAIAGGVAIAAVCGYLYAQLLNRLKGEEMSVTTYVGFSIVSLMCIAWLVLPFTSLKLRWPLGTGLRNTIGLDSGNFRHILNNFASFKIGKFVVPTGLLLFMILSCFLVWLFSRSKTGVAMQAVGNNPRFAEAAGINVNKMRIIGTVLSTVLGAVGILVYSQSYGFMQLYTAPRQMGFIAASAILIGGATTSRCKISHVLIGTFLFQGVLTLGMPVANVLVPGSTISETLRILISNGIILYALTKSGGASRA